MGSIVGLMVTSKRVYAKGDLPRLLLPVPCPCGEPLLTHTSTGDPPTLAGRFGSVPCGVIPLGLGVHKILFVPSKTGVSVSLSPVELL